MQEKWKTTVLINGRRTGKTEALVRWMRKDDRSVMLCHNDREARRVEKQYGLWGRVFPITDSRAVVNRSPWTTYCVDNVDLVLPGTIQDKGVLWAQDLLFRSYSVPPWRLFFVTETERRGSPFAKQKGNN